MSTTEEMYDAAIQLQQDGHMEAAIEKLKELLAQDESYALGHAALSVFYGKREQSDDAVKHAQRVCELEPEDPFSFIALSLICQKAGRVDEAERALWQARQAQFAAQQKENP